MEKTIEVLNELERRGIIGRYAIGGAMAATFYAEPLLTFDLDVFVSLPRKEGLITLAPLYEELRKRGYAEQRECVEIDGVAVQFLPTDDGLTAEALDQARETPYGSATARVFTAEHLVAICLQTGRAKDRERVRLLSEEGVLEGGILMEILKRHGLEKKWAQWT